MKYGTMMRSACSDFQYRLENYMTISHISWEQLIKDVEDLADFCIKESDGHLNIYHHDYVVRTVKLYGDDKTYTLNIPTTADKNLVYAVRLFQQIARTHHAAGRQTDALVSNDPNFIQQFHARDIIKLKKLLEMWRRGEDPVFTKLAV